MVRPQHPWLASEAAGCQDLAAKLDGELQAAGSEPVVLGFFQGAAMAIEVGLSRPLAGVIGCSGYPHPDWSLTQAPQAPTLLMHGADDAVVPVAARRTRAEISRGRPGGAVHLRGGHTIPIEVERAAKFLAAL